LTGDYNSAVKAFVSKFLRPFTESEKKAIKGSADIYAHDAYTSQFYFAPPGGVDACINDPTNDAYPSCAATQYTYTTGWLLGPAADPLSPWLHKATDWVPIFLRYMKDTWADPAGNLPLAVTEFGFGEPFEAQKTLLQDILYDPIRMSYYRDYMEAILMSISEGINVVGCLAWSLYDNYEVCCAALHALDKLIHS
jgi:beta-glucosidase